MRTKEYVEMEGLNSGLITAFLKSPEHALAYLNQDQDESWINPSFIIGNMTEMLVYSRGEMDCLDEYCVIVPDDLNLTKGEGYKINKEAKAEGLAVVKRKVLMECLQMAENLMKLPIYEVDSYNEMAELPDITLEKSKFRHSCPIQFEIGGILCKAELDLQVLDMGNDGKERIDRIFDIKTTGSPLSKFQYAARDFGYWVQKLHYEQAFKAKYGYDSKLSFLVVSSKEPYLAQQFNIVDDIGATSTMEDVYFDALVRCDKWLKAGKPVKGYVDEPGTVSINADYLLGSMNKWDI